MNKIKYLVLWEIILLSLILIVINFIFLPNDIGFHTILLNPFLLVILLAVVRYGTKWGYLAGGIAIAFYLLTPPYGTDDLLGRLPLIALFLILIFIFGAIQAKYSLKIKELEEKVEEGTSRYKELNERYEVTSFLKENYEKKILTQTTTIADLYGDARNMQALDIEELYSEIHIIIQKYVEAEKTSLYLLEGQVLRLKSSAGYSGDEHPRSEISISESPYNLVFEKKELVSINEQQYKETVISDLPVFVGPLKDNSGDVIGILNVDNISLLKFNRVSRKVFSLVCEWASKAIENAVSYKIAEGRRIITSDTQIFKYQYCLMRLEEAFAASQKTGALFSLVLFSINDWQNVLDDNKKSVIKFVGRIIQQNMRDFDILTHFENEYEYAVLMSQATDEQIKYFINNVNEQMDVFNLKPFGNQSVLKVKITYTSDFASNKTVEELIAKVRG